MCGLLLPVSQWRTLFIDPEDLFSPKNISAGHFLLYMDGPLLISQMVERQGSYKLALNDPYNDPYISLPTYPTPTHTTFTWKKKNSANPDSNVHLCSFTPPPPSDKRTCYLLVLHSMFSLVALKCLFSFFIPSFPIHIHFAFFFYCHESRCWCTNEAPATP